MPPVEVRLTLPELNDTPADQVAGGDQREAERYVDEDFGGASLAGTTFAECGFERVSLHLTECRLRAVEAAVRAVPRSSWRSVVVSASRLGVVEAYESGWRSVLVEECKIGYLNARGSRWTDVTLQDCTVDELDLGGAELRRVSLPGCRIGTLHVAGATLHDVDLRQTSLQVIDGLAGLAGAWVSEAQLTELAPLLAAHLGVRVG
jgi:uncharacterized protein YjbI with pentapeptide repeats